MKSLLLDCKMDSTLVSSLLKLLRGTRWRRMAGWDV